MFSNFLKDVAMFPRTWLTLVKLQTEQTVTRSAHNVYPTETQATSLV